MENQRFWLVLFSFLVMHGWAQTSAAIPKTHRITDNNAVPKSSSVDETLKFKNIEQTVTLKLLSNENGEKNGKLIYEMPIAYIGLPWKTYVSVPNRLILLGNREMKTYDWNQIVAGSYVSNTLAEFADKSILTLSLPKGELQPAIELIQTLPFVDNVQPDMVFLKGLQTSSLPGNQGVNPGTQVSSFSGNPMQLSDSDNSGLNRVAIIDDGFSLKHPALRKANIVFQYNVDTRTQDVNPDSDEHSHGTSVLSLLAASAIGAVEQGLLSDAEYVLIKMTKAQSSNFILAFYIAHMLGADLVNASWTLKYLPEPLKELLQWQLSQSPSYHLLTAAGNKALDACVENKLSLIEQIIVVGSLDTSGEIASFSNIGPCVDIYLLQGFVTASADGVSESFYEGTSASTSVALAKIAKDMIVK